MKKSFLEHLKTVILAVLFVITILLLYLCFTQDGRSFSISDLLGGKSRIINISVDDYLLPEYAIRSNGDGTYNISYENIKELNKKVLNCADNLISSSTAKLVEINKTEYDRALYISNSIEAIYGINIPFDGLSNKLISRRLDSPENCQFNSLMFSDNSKECFFLRDALHQKYYKVVSGENYYSIEELLKVYTDGSVNANNINEAHDTQKVEAAFEIGETDTVLSFENEKVAQSIFGENFDFVRRIADTFGNETYMYGYGKKTLSFFVENNFIEFKEEPGKQTAADFYNELDIALSFIAQAFNIEDFELSINDAKLDSSSASPHYVFDMNIKGYNFVTEVIGSKVTYLCANPI